MQKLIVLLYLASASVWPQPLKFKKASLNRESVVFEANRGQAAPEVRFLARTPAYDVLLTDSAAVLVAGDRRPSFVACLKADCRSAPPEKRAMSIRMKLVGSHKPLRVEGRDPDGGASNYFIGRDPKQWRTGIPHYTKVEYRGVYPGVDLVYYGNRGSLEYDFIVNPGASSTSIRLAFEGADSVKMEGSHDVVAETRLGKLRLSRPRVFQFVAGRRVELAGNYVVKNSQVSFNVPDFDRTQPLLIDPTLSYSTYLGGSASDNALAVALDAAGNFYVAGETRSNDFPTTPGFQDLQGFNGFVAFVTKFSPAGQIVYSCYFGGVQSVGYQSTDSGAAAIAVDASGNAFVVGSTWATDFPTTAGAFQPQKNYNIDAFALKLNAAGNKLLYSTYLGGFENDAGLGVAIDAAGSAYVTGWTAANWDFPLTAGAFQTHKNTNTAAFVTKFSPDGSSLVYSTFLAGAVDQRGLGIAVDASANAYVTGWTSSSDFPTTAGAFKETGQPADAFVTKLNADGTAPVYSTLLGGAGDEQGWAIAIAPDGAAVVTGWTYSCGFPVTPGAWRTSNPCGQDKEVFLTKISPSGAALVYSTYFGGRGNDEPRALTLDNAGRPWLAGLTDALDFRTTPDHLQGILKGGTDAFVMHLSGDGKSLLFSSYLGGSGNDEAWGLDVDAAGNVYLAGFTESSDFPVTSDAMQRSIGGSSEVRDGFVVKISSGAASAFTTVSAASFIAKSPVARGSIVSGFGQALSASKAGASGIPLPTTLAGVTVTIRDSAGDERPAPLFYVSQSQVNYLIPEETATGTAETTVVRESRVVAEGSVQVERIAPALFAANANGQGVAAADAVRLGAGGTQTPVAVVRYDAGQGKCVAVPLDLGPATDKIVLVLYGTGIRYRSGLDEVRVQIGGQDSPVQYAGPQPQFVGLDQVNVVVPRTLAGRGQVDILLRVEGRAANTVTLTIK